MPPNRQGSTERRGGFMQSRRASKDVAKLQKQVESIEQTGLALDQNEYFNSAIGGSYGSHTRTLKWIGGQRTSKPFVGRLCYHRAPKRRLDSADSIWIMGSESLGQVRSCCQHLVTSDPFLEELKAFYEQDKDNATEVDNEDGVEVNRKG
jgi:hypothetical protein